MKVSENALVREAAEIPAIWSRYNGFLVLHAILAALTFSAVPPAWDQNAVLKPLVAGLIPAIGIVLCCFWHVMNFCGWYNQAVFYHRYASVLSGADAEVSPVGRHDKHSYRPCGPIYIVAQCVVWTVALVYAVAIGHSAASNTAGIVGGTLAALCLPMLLTFLVCYSLLERFTGLSSATGTSGVPGPM
jgi:hypothetical protein